MYSFWCSKKGIHHLYAVFLRWKMARGMRSVGQEKCDPVHPNTANRGGAHPSCWQRWTREGTRLGYLKVRCSAALSAASQSRVGRMLSGGASAVRSGMGYSGMLMHSTMTRISQSTTMRHCARMANSSAIASASCLKASAAAGVRWSATSYKYAVTSCVAVKDSRAVRRAAASARTVRHLIAKKCCYSNKTVTTRDRLSDECVLYFGKFLQLLINCAVFNE